MVLSVYGGCSRRLVEWVAFIIKALVAMVVATIEDSKGPSFNATQSQILADLSRLPKSLDGICRIVDAGVDTKQQGAEYICCPRCWALYHPQTMNPESHPSDCE